jgi:hypothetical protein
VDSSLRDEDWSSEIATRSAAESAKIPPRRGSHDLAMTTIKTLAAVLPSAVIAAALVAGCSTHETTPAAPTVTVTVTPTAPSTSAPSQAPSAPPTVTVTAAPSLPTPAAFGPCSDDDLTVTNEPMQSANTLRHVVVSFTNTSSHPCTLVGYPGADLVTPVGGLLINVPRRPGDAPRRLVLAPGDSATAEVQAYAVDTATGEACPRWGNIVVTPPNDFVSHSLSADLPICNATVSPVD